MVLGVRPFRPFSREVAELGRLFDREVVAQLDGSERARWRGAAARSQRCRTDIDAVLASVPRAVGVAWQAPAGRRQAPDRSMVDEVDRRQLLFVGARGRDRDKRVQLPRAGGDHTTSNADAVAAQLGALVAKARSDGPVIAIGTPTEATLEHAGTDRCPSGARREVDDRAAVGARARRSTCPRAERFVESAAMQRAPRHRLSAFRCSASAT